MTGSEAVDLKMIRSLSYVAYVYYVIYNAQGIAATRREIYVGLILGHRLRRSPNIKQT